MINKYDLYIKFMYFKIESKSSLCNITIEHVCQMLQYI